MGSGDSVGGTRFRDGRAEEVLFRGLLVVTMFVVVGREKSCQEVEEGVKMRWYPGNIMKKDVGMMKGEKELALV